MRPDIFAVPMSAGWGLAMLGLTIIVGLGVAIPYWEVLGLPLLSP
jgi:hypothetical protein